MKWLISMLVVFIAIQSVIIAQTPLVSWDEAVYIGMGKFLYSNNSGIFESFRPVFLPLILGAGWKIGINPVLFGRIIALAFSSALIVMFYLVCRHYLNWKMSLLASILLSIIPVYFFHSTKVFTDIISCFFVVAAFYCYLKNRPFLTAMLSGIATLTRFPAGMFFVFFLALFLAKKEKLFTLFKMCVIFLLCLSPFFIINLLLGNGIITPLLEAFSHQNNYTFNQDFFFYFRTLAMFSLFTVLAVPGIYYAFKEKKYGLIAFSLIPLAYFTSIINKQERFMLLFIPFIALLAVYGFYKMISPYKNSLITFALIFLVVLSAGISIAEISKTQFQNKAGYFGMFKNNNLTILTSEPIFSAYSDNRFIPMYFDIYRGNTAFDFYDNSDYTIYCDHTYPCSKYPDVMGCEKAKNELLVKLMKKELVYITDSCYVFR